MVIIEINSTITIKKNYKEVNYTHLKDGALAKGIDPLAWHVDKCSY